MIGGLNTAAKYRAILIRDKKYDGIFYFATKTSGIYCRPSCAEPTPRYKDCTFFETVGEAKAHGFVACKHCHPGRLEHNLSARILGGIEAGAINDKGVHGLANSLHISERHLRRLVRDRTGTSPVRLNKIRRLSAARNLVTQTDLPIIDIAFNSEFSSLRQFNDVFKAAFSTSPRQMRKAAAQVSGNEIVAAIVLPLKISYTALLRTSSHDRLTNNRVEI